MSTVVVKASSKTLLARDNSHGLPWFSVISPGGADVFRLFFGGARGGLRNLKRAKGALFWEARRRGRIYFVLFPASTLKGRWNQDQAMGRRPKGKDTAYYY
eukprot:1404268-Rhodomonas_salina.3